MSLGSLHRDVELNQEVCKGKEIAYFMKKFVEDVPVVVANVLHLF